MPQIKPLYIGLIAIHAPCVLCVVYIVCAYIPRVWYIPVCNNIINVPCRCVTQPFFLFFFFFYFTLPVYRVLYSRHIDVRTHESHLTYAPHLIHTMFARPYVVYSYVLSSVSVFLTGRGDRTVQCTLVVIRRLQVRCILCFYVITYNILLCNYLLVE